LQGKLLDDSTLLWPPVVDGMHAAATGLSASDRCGWRAAWCSGRRSARVRPRGAANAAWSGAGHTGQVSWLR